eukprot:255770_1
MEEIYPSQNSIKKWMSGLPDYPAFTLSDIEIHRNDLQKPPHYKPPAPKKSYSSLPSIIVGDWLYLGNHEHCKSIKVIQELGITHILCCSDIIPCYFLFDNNITIQYARVPIGDWYCSDIFNYFFAITQFIDSCNPLYNSSGHKNKILVHCEMGVSRSSTIVIAYLLAKQVELSQIQRIRLEHIQNGLFKHSNSNGNDNTIDANLLQLETNDMVHVRMKLNSSYYYVKSCRRIIEPNDGFILQLQKWEQICYNINAANTTLCDTAKYTKNREIKRLGKTAAKLKMDPQGNVTVDSNSCSCIIL